MINATPCRLASSVPLRRRRNAQHHLDLGGNLAFRLYGGFANAAHRRTRPRRRSLHHYVARTVCSLRAPRCSPAPAVPDRH
jgi:hypothetical protein